MEGLLKTIDAHNEGVMETRRSESVNRAEEERRKQERELAQKRQEYCQAVTKGDRAKAIELRRQLPRGEDPRSPEAVVDCDMVAVGGYAAAVEKLGDLLASSQQARAWDIVLEKAADWRQKTLDEAHRAKSRAVIMSSELSKLKAFGKPADADIARLREADTKQLEKMVAELAENFVFLPTPDGGELPIRKPKKGGQ